MNWPRVLTDKRIRARNLFWLCLMLIAAAECSGAQVRAVSTNTAQASRIYSSGVEAGDYLYVSGQGPRRPDGSIPTAFAEQCRQAFENVGRVVDSAGLSKQNVVYIQVYLQDMNDFREMDRVFGEYFGNITPARAVLGVARVPDPPIEVSAVAVHDLSGKRAVFPANSPRQGGASPGILTRDLLFISSMSGQDPVSGRVPEDAAAQVDLALDRLQAVAKAAGLSLSNMVFVNPYLTTKVSARVMNERYAHRFEFGNTPARATIEVSSLPGGANIEYTGVAVRDLAQRKVIRPKNMPPSPTASPCVFAGDILFCSAKDGFIPGPHGGVYATTTNHQLRQTMRNLLDNLEEADLSFEDVVSTNVYLDDLGDAHRFDDVYAQYFGAVAPARSVIQQIAPARREADQDDHFPGLEQVSLIAVRRKR